MLSTLRKNDKNYTIISLFSLLILLASNKINPSARKYNMSPGPGIRNKILRTGSLKKARIIYKAPGITNRKMILGITDIFNILIKLSAFLSKFDFASSLLSFLRGIAYQKIRLIKQYGIRILAKLARYTG